MTPHFSANGMSGADPGKSAILFPRMDNQKIHLTDDDLARIKRTAAEYGLDSLPAGITLKGPAYGFKHPDHKPWVFVLDWHWRKRWVRFHKSFIDRLKAAGLVVHEERGAGRNCSVEATRLIEALEICMANLSRPPCK